MVQVDINNVIAVNHNDLTSQEKDDLYENIIWLDLEAEVPPDKLEKLFLIAKEVLKYKGEQVETLLADLDVLASNTGIGVDEMRDELVKANKQSEHLVEEIQAKEKELLKEKSQVEKLLTEVADLQKEKSELRREMILIQNEAQSGLSTSLNEENTEDLAQIKETVQYKNKHILQLLSDTEVLEKENEMLTTKLNSIRRELTDATTNLTKLSGENISLRASNYELQEKITSIEERNVGLTSQVSELVSEKNRRDNHLDQLIDALEERVAKWQEVFSYKENEVAELKAKLSEMSQTSEPKTSTQFATNYTILAKTIEQQEEMIEQLQKQLKQAGDDLSKSTNEMIQFKQNAEEEPEEEVRKKMDHIKEELDKALSQVAYLQDKVKDAEQDAQFRAEEMTELIIQLREYEEGIYGLTEARSEVKDLKKQVAVRDKQILNLVQQFNNSDLNLGIKENTGSVDEVDDTTSNSELRLQLNQIQQTAINLSVQNFDLRTQVAKLSEQLAGSKIEIKPEESDASKKEEVVPPPPEKDNNYVKELEEKLQGVIAENEALRKGLHEIMESIKMQDGLSRVSIESECLEKLLEILDSRHMSGWYHPAMRLQVALNKMQGNNDALRQQLRETRFRECYFQAELQAAFMRIGELEGKLSNADIQALPPVPAPRTIVASPEGEETEEGIVHESEEKEEEEEEKSNQEEITGVVAGVDIPDVDKVEEEKEQKPASEKSTEKQLSPERTSTPGIKTVHLDSSTQTEFSPMLSKRNSEEAVNEIILKPKLSRQSSISESMVAVRDIDFIGIEQSISRRSSLKENGINGRKTLIERKESLTRPYSTKGEQVTPAEEDKQRELLNDVIEQMKMKTDNVLEELNESKKQLLGDIKSTMEKVNEHFEALKKEPPQVQNPISEQKEFKEHEEKIAHYGLELTKLKMGMEEKEKTVSLLQSEIDDLKIKLEESNKAVKANQSSKRVLALKETVKSLQAIVVQKEGVIGRCETLLQDNSKEYDRLLEQYRELESKITEQPPPSRLQASNTKAVTVLMQKWISRVQILENNIFELNEQLQISNESMLQYRNEADKWREIAEGYQNRDEEEDPLNEKNQEIEILRNMVKDMKSMVEEVKAKLRLEVSKHKKKEEESRIKAKEYEVEIHKLKHHQTIRVSKTHNVSSGKKELVLMDKIKELEQELALSAERQKNILQQRKDRCADEVAKWEERKKLQGANEKLRVELRERNLQLEEFETQITRLKQIITRMERERISLQRRLKVTEGTLTKSIIGLGKKNDDDLPDSRMAMSSRSESPFSDAVDQKVNLQSRKDLIKAVASLRKVVAKLRSQHSNYVHKDYVEQLQKELQKMEENYLDAVERSLALEEQLRESEAKFYGNTYTVEPSDERTPGLICLKEQLNQKCELLSKVKVLLQRAMMREKQLLQQVTLLEKLVPPEKLVFLHEEEREP